MKLRWMFPLVVGMLAAGAVLFTGCEDGSDSVAVLAGTGNSVVKGNVADLGVDIVGGAVPGARVYLEGTDIEGLTDAGGRFTFSGVPAGTYILVIEYNGVVVTIEITVTDSVEVEVREIVRNEDGTVSSQIIVRPINPIIDVSGNYVFSRHDLPANGYVDRQMTLEQSGKTLAGTIGDAVAGPILVTYSLSGTIRGKTVTLLATPNNVTVAGFLASDIELTGTVGTGGLISGTWTEAGNTGTWMATPQ